MEVWKIPTGVLLMHAIYFNKFLRFWHSGSRISIIWVNLSHVGDTSSVTHGTTISDHFLRLLTSHCKELSYQAMCSFAWLFLTLYSVSILLLNCLKDHRWQSCWYISKSKDGIENWEQGNRAEEGIMLFWTLILVLSWKSHNLLLHWFSPAVK